MLFQATQDDDPLKESMMPVTITIQDNDNVKNPVFTEEAYQGTVEEVRDFEYIAYATRDGSKWVAPLFLEGR